MSPTLDFRRSGLVPRPRSVWEREYAMSSTPLTFTCTLRLLVTTVNDFNALFYSKILLLKPTPKTKGQYMNSYNIPAWYSTHQGYIYR